MRKNRMFHVHIHVMPKACMTQHAMHAVIPSAPCIHWSSSCACDGFIIVDLHANYLANCFCTTPIPAADWNSSITIYFNYCIPLCKLHWLLHRSLMAPVCMLYSLYLDGGGGGCSCMLLHPTPTCAGPTMLVLTCNLHWWCCIVLVCFSDEQETKLSFFFSDVAISYHIISYNYLSASCARAH